MKLFISLNRYFCDTLKTKEKDEIINTIGYDMFVCSL